MLRHRLLFRSTALALCGLVSVAASHAYAQQASAPPASLRETAEALARSGLAHNDSRAVLGAAHLLVLSSSPDAGIWRVDSESEDSAPTVSGVELSPASLLREVSRIAVASDDRATLRAAYQLAVDPDAGIRDQALPGELLAAIEQLGTTRGAVGGPIRWEGGLVEQDSAVYQIRFEGHVPNGISVSASNPGSDISCVLKGASQEPVRSPADDGTCYLAWKQSTDGEVTLEVHNAGKPTHFVVISN